MHYLTMLIWILPRTISIEVHVGVYIILEEVCKNTDTSLSMSTECIVLFTNTFHWHGGKLVCRVQEL